MSTEANKAVVTEFIERVWEQLDPDAVDDLVADDFESHAWPTNGDGKGFLKQTTERMAKTLADIDFTVDDLIAEDDKVVARVRSSARQVGEFMGMPPSGRTYEIGEIHIFRLRDGKLVEHWDQIDTMGLMKQLKGD